MGPYLKRMLGSALVIAAIVVLTGHGSVVARAATNTDKPLIVFAAASLKNAMDEVAQAYEARRDQADIKISYAGSSTLARQIEAGAPADIYISANEQWMNQLDKDGLIDSASRIDLLNNTLVLITSSDRRISIELKRPVDLASRLGANDYLAMANTDAVPAGIYGQQALQSLHAWAGLQGRIAQADDVRGALALVSRGESPLGVVYASDAVADPEVRVAGRFPADSHDPIVYPAAATADSDHPNDAAFLAFLRSDTAARIFKRWGFETVDTP